ncbi:MAG: hypothetical protein ACOYLB_00270 [Phototrophicaceae bacterium]
MIAGISYLALSVSMILLALLSRRLGQVTVAPPNYIGVVVGAILVGISGLARIGYVLSGANLDLDWWLIGLFDGIPSIGVTVAVVYAWRYWSWLFAERG